MEAAFFFFLSLLSLLFITGSVVLAGLEGWPQSHRDSSRIPPKCWGYSTAPRLLLTFLHEPDLRQVSLVFLHHPMLHKAHWCVLLCFLLIEISPKDRFKELQIKSYPMQDFTYLKLLRLQKAREQQGIDFHGKINKVENTLPKLLGPKIK